jgi:UDP-N-acetylglucosamine--N-acetylmuramyl-(pentapeptide) pyrophosphoryl-undecaprenol N-acetylglucosamine transferase
MNKPSVLLAAGGTGGHLFPALALAQELARRGVPVDLATDRRAERYGGEFPARSLYQIPSATLTRRTPLSMARTAWILARGVRAAYRLLTAIRPAVVVGFGGYPSLPPLIAAYLRRIPTVLHEQNAVLGRANRLLARQVDAIATSFETVACLPGQATAKVRLTGNPVRDAVLQCAAQPWRAPEVGAPFSLVVFGGSQGARFFSDVLPAALPLLPDEIRRRLWVSQQCREEDLGRVEDAYSRSGIECELAAFFPDLAQRMADAHLVIARAGASTVAELAVIGRPSILVPLPHALDNDQLRNATRLAESGGAWCIEQKDLTPERLAREIERVVRRPELLANAAAAARAQGRADAAARLADLAESLMERYRSPA